MMYYILQLDWSQTDKDMVIVQANSKEEAIARFKYANGPRYVNYYGCTDKIIKAK